MPATIPRISPLSSVIPASSRRLGADLHPKRFLRFSNPAIAVKQQRERDDDCQSQRHHLWVGHPIIVPLPRVCDIEVEAKRHVGPPNSFPYGC